MSERAKWNGWTTCSKTKIKPGLLMPDQIASLIDQLAQLKRELRGSEERFRNIITHNADGMLVVDVDGLVHFANPAAGQLLGCQPAELTGRPFGYPVIAGENTEIDLLRAGAQPLIAEMRAMNTHWEGAAAYVVSLRDVTERRRIERALRDSQLRLALALDAISEGLWDWNLSTGVVYLSPQWLTALGYRADTFPPDLTYRERLIHPDDFPLAEASLQDHLAGRTPSFECEYRVRTMTGDWRWCLDRGKAVEWDQAGRPIRVLGAIIDVTERHSAAVDLQLSERKYRVLAESLPQIVFEADATGRLIFSNHLGFVAFGYTRADLERGVNVLDTIIPEDRGRAADNIARILRGELSGVSEYTGLRRDGSTFPIAVYSSPIIRDNQSIGLSGFIVDISESRRVQEELRRSEESYRSLVDNLPLGIYRTTPGPRGEFLVANAALLKLFGYDSLEQLRTVSVADLYTDPAERALFSDRLLEEGRLTGYELRLRKRDGSPLWGSVTARVVQDKARDTLYFDCILEDVTEQRRVRLALLESEERFRNLAESLPQVVFETDALGQLSFVNRTGYQVFGYTPRDIERGLSVFQTIAPVDRARARHLLHWLKEQPLAGEEYLAVRRNGDVFPVEIYASPITRDGHVAGLRGFIIDITDRKRVEAAEREQRTLAEALRDTAAALNSTLDFEAVLDLILTNVDRIAPNDCASILLIDREQRAAHSVRLTTQPDITTPPGGIHLSLAEAGNLRVMLNTGQASIVSNVREYAEWVQLPRFEWVGSHAGAPIRARGHIVGFLNLYSRVVGFFTAQHARDLQAFADQAGVAIQNSQLYEQVQQYAAQLEARVSQRTAELERERQRLQAILDTAGEGIVFTDLNGTIEYMNPAMERLTGFTSAQALGQTPRLWSSGRTPVTTYDQMWQTILHGDIWHGEVVNRHRDGSLYDTAMIIAPLLNADREIIGFVGLQRDITRQKELDRLKDQFVANVSHELRTPLANVKLYLSMLERGLPERRTQYLQTLLRESGRLENLIENLLSISRLDMRQLPIELTPTDVNQLVTQLVFDRAALITERGLLLENRPAADLPLALADPALVIQILSNLMTNATHYTPPGGIITLSTARQQRHDLTWVTLTVKDSGPGITTKDSPHLFERFYRGEAGRKSGTPGTGLGLAICREIAEQLGGEITVDSRPGQGAAFTVWLRST